MDIQQLIILWLLNDLQMKILRIRNYDATVATLNLFAVNHYLTSLLNECSSSPFSAVARTTSVDWYAGALHDLQYYSSAGRI